MRLSRNSAFHSCVTLMLAMPCSASAAEGTPAGANAGASDQSSQAQDAKAPDSGRDSDWTADFSLLEEYRLRIASGTLASAAPLGAAPSTNQQIDQHLRLLGDGQISGANDHFRAILSGAMWLDLDGRSAPGTAPVFATAYDNAQPYIAAYALSAEWQKHGLLDHARVGRQASEHGMPLTFDGASLGLRLLDKRLLLFGFGGRTVHFFETKPGLFENWVGSVGAVLRPSAETAIEFDGRFIQEQLLAQDRDRRTTITNGSYGLAATLRNDSLFTKVFARGIDDRISQVGGAFQFQSEPMQLGFDARVAAQLVTLGEVVESENPFFSLLGPSLPHARYRFEAWKDIPLFDHTKLALQLGWRGRQLIGHAEQPFNRNTGSIYLQARLDDLGQKGLFLGGTAEMHFVPQALAHERLFAFGGSTGYASTQIKTEVGTYYQQFKINYYQRVEELHNARTVYGSLAYRLVDWLELRGRYEMDIFDRYLQSFFISARQDF